MTLGGLSLSAGVAANTWLIEPKWVEVVEVDMPIPNLPAAFESLKIAHISDLHLSDEVSKEYLLGCVEKINSMNPDIAVMTGDYVTMLSGGKYGKGVAEIFDAFKTRLGCFGCLGNHDYGVYRRHFPVDKSEHQNLHNAMGESKVWILKNSSKAIEIDGQQLWITGLGDYWARDFKPEAAFDGIAEDEFKIALLHNPDAIFELKDHKPHAILCGHTHGGQVRLPFLGAPVLPIKNRWLDAGSYNVNDSFVYVNRGLGVLPGFTGSVRFNCRPEITLYTLKKA